MTNQDNNDFLRADIYKNLSSSLSGSLNSLFADDTSRRNSVLEVRPASSESSGSDLEEEYDSPTPSLPPAYSPVPLTEEAFLKNGETVLSIPVPVTEPPPPAAVYNLPPSIMDNPKLKIASGAVAVLLVSAVAVALSSIHRIEEGNVGVYYRNGALMQTVSFPGIHYMTPFIVEVVEIKIRPETDILTSTSAITKDGIQNTFNDIQVITSIKMDNLVYMLKNYGPQFKKALVFDRIKEELRIFCANSTIDEVYNTKFLAIVDKVRINVKDSIDRLGEGGINLLNLVIPKPDIPRDIAMNYKAVKVQWTEQLVATQQQKTEEIKKETEKLRAIADAERNKAVLEIKIQERLLEKEGEANISAINNGILKQKEENIANIEKYKILSEASANKELYTPEYIQYNTAKNLANNTKFYFSGQESFLGGALSKIFNT